MKILLLLTIVFLAYPPHWRKLVSCAASVRSADGPQRLVVIKGTAKIINLPGAAAEVPATSETLIFQKDGCESCFIGTNVDAEGHYKILVGDGKYKIIVNSPSAPHVDLLAPGQERFIDTTTGNNSSSIYTFNIRIKIRKS